MNLKKNNNMNVPKKKVEKNDVYAIILAILIIFWTIASVFGFIGYARASKNRDTGMITASAEAPPDIGLPTVNYATLHFNQYENFMLYNSTDEGYYLSGLWRFVGDTMPTLDTATETVYHGNFVSNGISFSTITVSYGALYYDDLQVCLYRGVNEWGDPAWKTLGFGLGTLVSREFYDFIHSEAEGESWNGDSNALRSMPQGVTINAWAQSLGYQSFVFNGLSLSYNGWQLTDSEGEADLVADFYTQFLFSDYSVHNVLTNVIMDEPYGTPFFESSGFTILYRVDCEAFTDDTSFYLYYTLYFDWYEDINDNLPITSTFGFTVYYDFTDYINTEYISNGIYFPAMDVHATLADEYYYTYLYNEQYYKFNAYKEGYALGYGAGVDGGQDYTFFSLISSVIDAPIQAFTGLFNFDLLGINLTSFFLALLTVAVFIAVIRLIL